MAGHGSFPATTPAAARRDREAFRRHWHEMQSVARPRRRILVRDHRGCAAVPGPRHLLGAGRRLQHDPDGLLQDHRRQDQHVAQRLRRSARAADRGTGQPENRRMATGGRRRRRRPRPALRRPARRRTGAGGRCRQDDDTAHDRRAGDTFVRERLHRQSRCDDRAPGRAQRQHGVPELYALSAHGRDRQRRLRPRGLRRAKTAGA
jgi:hypothetical protein